MRKCVAKYVAEVQEVTPNARNPRNVDVRVLPHGSTYYYTVEARADVPLTVGQWYEVTLLLSPIAYTDKATGKPAAFITAWLLESVALAPAADDKAKAAA